MRRTLAALLLSATAITGTATAAFADKPVEIIVEDTAGVLDLNTLLPAVEDIDFYEPTTVAIYTRAGDYEDNFNEEVLKFARAERPDWISEDGQKWADGLYLFALDPVGRQVGTYMGEDRKVSLGDRTAIQESTYDLLRDAQWTDGTIKGIESGAAIINRPWNKSPVFIGIVVLVSGGTAAGIGAGLYSRAKNLRRSREALSQGNASYASVTGDLDVTELNANTIPSDSPYGARILEKYRAFSGSYAKATKLGNTVNAFTDKDMKKGSRRRQVEEFARLAAELDDEDDVIADTNHLLNMAPGWERAWDRQVEPFRTDLGEIQYVLGKQGSAATANALASFRDASLRTVEEWPQQISARRITPEQALDQLRDARSKLSELIRQHAYAAADAYAKTQAEARTMRRELDNSFNRPARRHTGIIDTSYPGTVYISTHAFFTGYSSGTHRVTSSRQAAERTSSGTGYGSSGGSFSGSGSSSRF